MSTIQPMELQRDKLGFWTHPEWPRDGDEDAIPKSWFADNGLDLAIVEMDGDAPEELAAEYFEMGLVDCTPWSPSKPDGEGWFVFSIHDSDDGPVCVWVRHKQ